MERAELQATTREILGKKVNALRRSGLTPANLYGHGVKSIALQLETPALRKVLSRVGQSSLLSLKVDGATPRLVLIRGVQREPRSGELLHVDFYQVKAAEKLRASVPLVPVGEAPMVKDLGGTLLHNLNSVEVECLPTDLPPSLEVDLSSLTNYDQAIHVKDISLPDGVTLLSDPEELVARVAAPRASR